MFDEGSFGLIFFSLFVFQQRIVESPQKKKKKKQERQRVIKEVTLLL